MDLLTDLIASITQDAPVRSILVGAHWTAVCSRGCGLAATILDDHPHGQAKVREAGHLHHKSAQELAEYALSENLLEASIGVAALNSLLEVNEAEVVELNAGEALARHGQGKKIALVGHFPFIPELQQVAQALWVIEQRPVEGEYVDTTAADFIPQADLVAITGSALINHTLDGLLALCPAEALVMVLGPSTPLSAVLFDHGATIVSGARVIDEAAVLRTVGQGANFRQVEGVRRLNIVKKEAVNLWNLS
jgi:uncharacterized protein